MVEVDNLTKKYGDLVAIDSVSFEARPGEIVGFLGKNGAGKTTTMRVMTGFMPPTSGTVRIHGFDIRQDSLEARRLIGYLPETAPLYDDMTVRQYLSFCARLRGVPGRATAEKVQNAMESVHIDQRRSWIIGKLSKGLRRRVGLAQALVHEPQVLILDEPTEGLDPEQIIEIRNLILNLKGNRTIILSTHILTEAQALADRIIIIDSGRVIAMDSTENLSRTARQTHRIRIEVDAPAAAVRERLGAIAGIRSVEPLPGDRPRFMVETDPGEDLRRSIAATVVQAGWPLLELERIEPALEDIFLQLTGRPRPEPQPEAAEAAA